MQIELKIIDREFFNVWHQELPYYATEGSAGVDLCATKDYVIAPQERIKIPTGIAIHIGSGNKDHGMYHKILEDDSHYVENVEPVSFMGMIVPRSGLGTQGLVLANTVGVIDEDYKSEIIISAWNVGATELKLSAGDRICQMVFIPVVKASWLVVDEFSDPEIKREGFGSTGV